ncbi:hypothetical protein NMG60_11033407 [Bertholletia excelsa]
MASNLFTAVGVFLLGIISRSWIALASDADTLSDFIASSSATVDGSFFTFTGIRGPLDANNPPNFEVTKAGLAEFPALNGQSVSMAVLQFPAGGINPPHTHPRSAELLLVVEGSLKFGFGLVHYQYNSNDEDQATAVSAFGSANAGTVSIPTTLFTTGIDDIVLAKAFKTDVPTIQKIKASLAPKA